jgi:hypothetical protein
MLVSKVPSTSVQMSLIPWSFDLLACSEGQIHMSYEAAGEMH